VPKRKRKRSFWARLRPKRVRAGVKGVVPYAEAEWEEAKPRKRRRQAKAPPPPAPVVPPVPFARPEDIDPLDRLLVDAQEHLVKESRRALKRNEYGDAVVAGAVSAGIYRVRKRPPKAV
jgi:hypothetical protein